MYTTEHSYTIILKEHYLFVSLIVYCTVFFSSITFNNTALSKSQQTSIHEAWTHRKVWCFQTSKFSFT